MSLILWLPFDGDFENQGVGDISSTQLLVPNYTAGKVTPKSINKPAQRLNIPVSEFINGATLSFWVKHGTPTSWTDIVSYGSAQNRIEATDVVGQYKWYATDKTKLLIANGAVAFTLTEGIWTHIAMTVDGSTVRFYKNGVLASEHEQLLPLIESFGTSDNMFIGVRNSATTDANRWDGSLDDFRMYDYSMTEKEIKELSQGLVAHYRLSKKAENLLLNTSDPVSLAGLVHAGDMGLFYVNGTINDRIVGEETVFFLSNESATSIKRGYTSRTPQLKPNTEYTFSMDVRGYGVVPRVMLNWIYDTPDNKMQNLGGTGGGYTVFTDIPQDVWTRISWTFTTTEDVYSGYIDIQHLGSAEDGDFSFLTFTNLKLEEGNVDTGYIPSSKESNKTFAIDSSHYNWDGMEIANVTHSSDSPCYSSSCSFDGNAGGIQLPIAPIMKNLLANQFTLNFWVKENNVSSRSVYFGGYDKNPINIEQHTGALRVWWNNNPDLRTANNSIKSKTWTMLTVVVDRLTGIKLYQDGKLKAEHNGVLTDYSNNVLGDFYLGRDSRTGETAFAGNMSDFRIYATALSAEDISKLHQNNFSYYKDGKVASGEFCEREGNISLGAKLAQSKGISEMAYSFDMQTQVLMDDFSAWAKIHSLDVTGSNPFFTDQSDVLQHYDKTERSNRFSRMNWVDYFKSTGVPKGYTRIEYIQTNGTQYIDTGFVPNQNTKVSVDFINEGAFGPLFGSRYNQTTNAFVCWVDANVIYPHYGNAAYNVKSLSVDTRQRFVFEMDKNVARCGTNTVTCDEYTFAAPVPMVLFCQRNRSGLDARYVTGKMYRCQIFDNGIIVRDFVPCINYMGQAGLYERIQDQFYMQASGDAFGAGPEFAGEYEFMLTYPSIAGYNRWIQTSSPNDSVVTNYYPVSISWRNHSHGLRRVSSKNTEYDCDTGSTWYAPIGQYKAWDATRFIPAADGSNQKSTELWVRIDNLSQDSRIRLYDNNYIQAAHFCEV